MHEVPELRRYLPVRRIELAFVRLPGAGGRSFRVQKDLADEDEVARYQTDVRAKLSGLIGEVRAIHDGAVVEPDPAATCRLCSFQPLCPLWPQAGEVIPV